MIVEPHESQRDATVLFTWLVGEALQDYLRAGTSALPVTLLFPEAIDDETLIELAPRADIMLGWRPSQELLAAAGRLTLFMNPGAGVQHLLELFRAQPAERSILLANGHGNAAATAEHTVALLLALMKRIVPHHNWMYEGRWRTGDGECASLPLRGRSVGLLGYGAVNRCVHRYLSGFDLSFNVLRRSWNGAARDSCGSLHRFEALMPFLEASDILIVAVPMTPETKGLIDGAGLDCLGPEGLVVNVARGPVIVEQDFYAALDERRIAGAAIDVWYEYKPEADDEGRKHPFTRPFHELDNVVLSPHRAASPFDDLRRWDEVIENIGRFVSGVRPFLNIVDLERGY